MSCYGSINGKRIYFLVILSHRLKNPYQLAWGAIGKRKYYYLKGLKGQSGLNSLGELSGSSRLNRLNKSDGSGGLSGLSGLIQYIKTTGCKEYADWNIINIEAL